MTGFRFFTTLLLLTMIAMVAAPSGAQTSSPEGQTFTFPWPPDWVARGKYQKMILRGITGYNPGQWDVHACGTLPDCLMPSSPQFNGLVYHDPVNPDRIVCDLCESFTVSRDGKTYTFRLRQAQWHDGQPVTAADIKFSLDRIVEPNAIRVRTGVPLSLNINVTLLVDRNGKTPGGVTLMVVTPDVWVMDGASVAPFSRS